MTDSLLSADSGRRSAFPNVNHFKDGPVDWPHKVMVGPFLNSVLKELWGFMRDDFLKFNFLIYQWPSWASYELKPPFPPNTVLIILADNSGSYPWELAREVTAIFKVHMTEERKNIFPIPLGHTKFHLTGSSKPVAERRTTVFYSGNINKNRIQLWAALRMGRHLASFVKPLILRRALTYASRKIPGALAIHQPVEGASIQFTDKFASGLCPTKYTDCLNDSKIALCPMGFYKTECFRHFEAMRSGCVILSDPLPDAWYFRGSPIREISDWSDITVFLRQMLDNPESLVHLQKSTINWWIAKCGEHAVARYMAEKLVETVRE